MIMVLMLSQRSSLGGTKPEAGSSCQRTETSMMSMMPSQKFGIDRPDSATTLAA